MDIAARRDTEQNDLGIGIESAMETGEKKKKEQRDVFELPPDELKDVLIKKGESSAAELKTTGSRLSEKLVRESGTESGSDQENVQSLSAEADDAVTQLRTELGSSETQSTKPETSRQRVRRERLEREAGLENNEQQEQIHALQEGISRQIEALSQIVLPENKGDVSSPEHMARVKDQLRQTMESMNAFAQIFPPSDAINLQEYTTLYKNFKSVVDLKGASGDTISKGFSEVFHEFSDFVDDEIVAKRAIELQAENKMVSIEDVTMEVYGRSKEEMEIIKQKNREEVVKELKKIGEEPVMTSEMLLQLHRVNNRGVVPKKYSALREGEAYAIFFKRVGTMPGDVRAEVDDVMERATDLSDQNALGEKSRLMYEIAAAKLHNDMLDIHPFSDRNGSTSLLFLEAMMTKVGYEPQTTREPDYYKFLRKVLGNNPVAVGIVGYEQYKMANTPGHYEGVTMTPDKKMMYERVMQLTGVKKKKA